MLEGALEYEWSAQQAAALTGDASGVSSTSSTLDERGAVALRPAQPPAAAPAPKQIAARIGAALSKGDTLIVPARVLADADGGPPGWWAVGAAGDTRAVWGDDLHGVNNRLDPSRIWCGRARQAQSFRPARAWHVDEEALRRPARRPPRGGRGGGGNEYLTLLQNVSVPVSEFFGSATGQWITVGVATAATVIAGIVAFS